MKKVNRKIKTFINIALATLIAIVVSSCLKNEDEPKTYSAAEETASREAYLKTLIDKNYDIDTTASGVYYVVLEEGEGEFASVGDSLTVGYRGYLIDGTVFDDSSIHNAEGTYGFVLGKGNVIDGWDQGLQVMNEGAWVQFIIPSESAYGAEGYLSIPPYQTLVFVINLKEIHSLDESN